MKTSASNLFVHYPSISMRSTDLAGGRLHTGLGMAEVPPLSVEGRITSGGSPNGRPFGMCGSVLGAGGSLLMQGGSVFGVGRKYFDFRPGNRSSQAGSSGHLSDKAN